MYILWNCIRTLAELLLAKTFLISEGSISPFPQVPMFMVLWSGYAPAEVYLKKINFILSKFDFLRSQRTNNGLSPTNVQIIEINRFFFYCVRNTETYTLKVLNLHIVGIEHRS